MLAAIREKVTGVLAAVIIGMLIIPFALWGVNSYFDGGAAVYVAQGDGIKVTQNVYQTTLNQYRGSVAPEQFASKAFRMQVVDNLVAESLLAREADRNGFRVSNETLRLFIEKEPVFQRNNQFDNEIYKTALAARRMSPVQYESQLRDSLIKQQLETIYSESAIVTKSDIERALALMAQEREIRYTIVSPDPFLAATKITDEDVNKYYEENKDRMVTPERVKLEYIELSAKALIAEYEPSNEELREMYKNETGISMTTPEKRRVSHILVEVNANAPATDQKKALTKIQSLESRLKKGESFSRLAKKESDDPGSAGKGGDLGYLSPGVMAEAFESAAFALKKGKVSNPVKTKFGYHLIKVTKLQVKTKLPFSQVSSKLKELAIQQKGEQRFYDLSESFYNLTYENADSLKPAADELNLQIKKTDWMARTGGAAGITSNKQVVAAAFSPEVLEQGRNSEAIELDDTTLVAIRVAEHQRAEPFPLAGIKENIITQLKYKQAREKMVQLSYKLANELKAGQDPAKIAASNKLKPFATGILNRNVRSNVDHRIIKAAFKAKRPEAGKVVAGTVDLQNKGYAIYVLKRVKDGGSSKEDAALRLQVGKMFDVFRGSDYFKYYGSGLRKQANIKVSTDNL